MTSAPTEERSETGDSEGSEPASAAQVGSFVVGLASLLRPQGLLVLFLGFALLVELAFSLGLPFGLQLIFDGLTDGAAIAYVLAVVGVLGVAMVAYAIAGVARDYLSARIGVRVTQDLRTNLFDHLQRMSLSFYRRERTGDLVARFSSDVPAIEYAVTRGFPLAVYNLFLIALSIALLFYIEWRLALLTLVVSPLVMLGSQRVTDRAAEASLHKRQAEGETASLVQEAVRGHMLVKAFGLSDLLKGRLSAKFDDLSRHGFRLSLMSALVGRIGNLSVVLMMLVILGVGATMVAKGVLSVGALIAFVALLLNVDDGTRAFTEAGTGLLQAVGGLARVRQLLAEDTGDVNEAERSALRSIREAIEFQGVTYTYEDGRGGIRGINLRIRAGESVAIVGPSGCGKSTLLSLITRMVEPDSGTIAIDGIDIASVNHDSLLGRLAWVLQDTFMFDTTIHENILYGRPAATEEDVMAAAKAAGLHDIIASLPEGYGTVVGEAGDRLSGGQRQRVALARAFLRKPEILVLDEPTSALDPATEEQVTKFILNLTWPCTVVMVTHRLAAATGVDRVIVLKDGELTEQGSHDELVAKRGEYSHLWSKQSGFALTGDGSSARVETGRLKEIPLFAKLDDVHLEMISDHLSTAQYEEAEDIIREGQEGDRFYVIVRGAVDILKNAGEDSALHLATLEVGDYVGEIALIEDIPTTATVRTRMSTTCVYLTREHFHRILETAPDLRQIIEATIRERLKDHEDDVYAASSEIASDTGLSH